MIKACEKTNIGIFGFGNMGQAIFKLLAKQAEINFFIYSIGVTKIKRAVCLKSFEELVGKCDYIFLCLKPQDFYDLKPAKTNNKVFISIMAGVGINNIKKIINSRNIVRVMPNLPLQVGQGVIAWYAKDKKFKNQLNFIKKIFTNFGYSFRVSRESELDKITAISGSGPAYIFLFMDALIRASLNLGFKREQSEQIILQLFRGSLQYFKDVKKTYTLKSLIKMVKSKKGTTEAALNELNTKKFYQAWQSAINQAYRRAKEISHYEIK